LLLGHINQLAARAVANGRDVMNVLRACSLNAVKHYALGVGLLQVGDPADFVLVNNLQEFQVQATYIDGECVARDGKCLLPSVQPAVINQFGATPIQVGDLEIAAKSNLIRIMEAIDGQLITRSSVGSAHVVDGVAMADPTNDLLKLVVVNRYANAKPSVSFVRGFGFSAGAIASSVAHDSHNVIAVGASDADLGTAINAVIENSGGLSVAHGDTVEVLPLPVAGLMSTESCQVVGKSYGALDQQAKQMGCPLRAPFMTLSFLALLVIPSLKLSDKGLFDVDKFEFVDLFV
jgi:adenine deaminase